MRSWWVDVALLLVPKQVPAASVLIMSNLACYCSVATLACTSSAHTVWGLLPVQFFNGLTLKIKLLKSAAPISHPSEVFSLWSPHQKFSNPTRKSSLKLSNDILCVCRFLTAIFWGFAGHWEWRWVKQHQILQLGVLQEDYHQLRGPQMFETPQSWHSKTLRSCSGLFSIHLALWGRDFFYFTFECWKLWSSVAYYHNFGARHVDSSFAHSCRWLRCTPVEWRYVLQFFCNSALALQVKTLETMTLRLSRLRTLAAVVEGETRGSSNLLRRQWTTAALVCERFAGEISSHA